MDDESRTAHLPAKDLPAHSDAVNVAADGETAIYQTCINDYDLVILDVMLPGRDGIAVCQEWRSSSSRVPVLMLTARDAVTDRIAGLEAGADDYLTKPFDLYELLARIRALRN